MKKNVGRSVQLPRIKLNLLLPTECTDASWVTIFRLPKHHPPSVDGSSRILLPLFELSGSVSNPFWTICPVGVTASTITISLHVVGVASMI